MPSRSVSICASIVLRLVLLVAVLVPAPARAADEVADVPTRAGVTERLLLSGPSSAKATVVLLAGGHGGLQLASDGTMAWGRGNFLIRSRQRFADAGLRVAVLDAPSDRQGPPFLQGFRQTREHVQDLKAVIAWLRVRAAGPVWLVGTSRGTQSAAFVATELAPPDGPDGVVLTSTILTDPRGRAVPEMPLDRIGVPVLVVHHEQDGCRLCSFGYVPRLMSRLSGARPAELISVTGGADQGDPCEAFAHHGFNGLEDDVVRRIAAWIDARR